MAPKLGAVSTDAWLRVTETSSPGLEGSRDPGLVSNKWDVKLLPGENGQLSTKQRYKAGSWGKIVMASLRRQTLVVTASDNNDSLRSGNLILSRLLGKGGRRVLGKCPLSLSLPQIAPSHCHCIALHITALSSIVTKR